MSHSSSLSGDRLPQRFFVLCALRCLSLGRPFIVLGTFSWGLMLDGAPYAAALFYYFLDHGWLQPLRHRDALPGVLYYGLSSKGASFLEKGESWWRSLRPVQKLGVCLLG